MAHDIGLHIDVWIDRGMTDARLGCQVENTVAVGVVVGQAQYRFAVGDVGFEEGKAAFGTQRLQSGEFQHRIVIFTEIVDPDDLLTPVQQRAREIGTDETGDACDENGHEGMKARLGLYEDRSAPRGRNHMIFRAYNVSAAGETLKRIISALPVYATKRLSSSGLR